MAVGRVADRDRLGDRVRFHRLREVEAGLERADDRRRSGCLHRVDARQIAIDPAQRLQLLECAADARQQCAAGDGTDDVLREFPAELLDDLEAVRLCAFRVIRPQVDVGEAPAVSVGNLRAEPVDVVVVALDGDDMAAGRWPSRSPCGFEVVGDEDVAGEAKTRGVRGHAVGQVAGRCAGEHVEPELDRTRGRDRHDAILVREGRVVHRVVFDEELANAERRASRSALMSGVNPE